MTDDQDQKKKLTPEQQAAYDDMRASPGILIGPDGNVIFDGEAEALGAPPFKTLAEIEANKARLEVLLLARRKERRDEQQRQRDLHWGGSTIVSYTDAATVEGRVIHDGEAEGLGIPHATVWPPRQKPVKGKRRGKR